MSAIRKSLAGFEDLYFDADGIGLKYDRLNSQGQLQEFSAINAQMVPLLYTTRLAPLYDTGTLTADDVDTAILQICQSLESIYKFPNQDVLDDITSAGSGVIMSTEERNKLTSITDVGSGKIITTAEREKLNTLDNVSAADLESLENVKKASPVGQIIMFPTEVPPEGFLLCDGQSLLRETYSELFGVIAARYGNVDTNTFNLPDLRGQFVRGWDNGATTDPDALTRTDRGDGVGGDQVGTKQESQAKFEDHYHLYKYDSKGNENTTWDDWDSNGQGTVGEDANANGKAVLKSSYARVGPLGADVPPVDSTSSETRPTNICMAYMIRALSV